VTTTFLLSIDGRLAGNLLGVSNGKWVGAGLLTPKNESLDSSWALECGTETARILYLWINDTMQQRFSRKPLQIMAVDASYRPHRTWDLPDALMTEIIFPALDTRSQGGATLLVGLKTERPRIVEISGEDKPIAAYARNKPWPTNRFRLSIDGLGGDSHKDLAAITHIDPLTYRVGVKNVFSGRSRSPEIEATKGSVSSLTLSLPERNSSGFISWLDATRSAKGAGLTEQRGQLQYLSHDSQPLLTLNFSGLEILSASKGGGNVKVELYFRSVTTD